VATHHHDSESRRRPAMKSSVAKRGRRRITASGVTTLRDFFRV
jgi:hypothetical protein